MAAAEADSSSSAADKALSQQQIRLIEPYLSSDKALLIRRY
jgi:hypothetical protein